MSKIYCKLKYVVIYLKLLTNFVILRSFGDFIYHFLNYENHTQIVSPGKKKLIRPDVV